jgi:hypothetical protein
MIDTPLECSWLTPFADVAGKLLDCTAFYAKPFWWLRAAQILALSATSRARPGGVVNAGLLVVGG